MDLKRAARSLKLGKLTGRVGASYLGEKIKGIFLSPEEMINSLSSAHQRNAQRIADTLGELKGAVMKLGQMASLQSDLLPPEITEILSGLQNSAPPMPFKVIKQQFLNEFGKEPETLYREFEPTAFASASIGQVHRAVTHDGRKVAVKVQYPKIEDMLEDDLRNLRLLFKLLKQAKPRMDFTLFFEEIKSHLQEELDYQRELANALEFKEKLASIKWVRIPTPIPELSSQRILTMELLEGLPARNLSRSDVPQERRDQFALRIAEMFSCQIFSHKLMHADPNLANFAIGEDNTIILYDFGCVKRFPGWFVDGMRTLVAHALAGQLDQLGEDLRNIGLYKTDGSAVESKLIEDYLNTLIIPFMPGQAFNFGASEIHKHLLQLGYDQWRESPDYEFPRHVVFINRVLGGMYGNFVSLRATGDWGAILRKYLHGGC